jgi:hypothetical protein
MHAHPRPYVILTHVYSRASIPIIIPGGLPQGAQIAIGVCALVAVLVLSVCLRRYRAQRAARFKAQREAEFAAQLADESPAPAPAMVQREGATGASADGPPPPWSAESTHTAPATVQRTTPPAPVTVPRMGPAAPTTAPRAKPPAPATAPRTGPPTPSKVDAPRAPSAVEREATPRGVRVPPPAYRKIHRPLYGESDRYTGPDVRVR